MNSIRKCNNRCIFCFVDQLPSSLRKSLYIKDDDFLLSFMYGNFITLTNLKSKDLDRIIRYRLEPLYVSVHSLNGEIRKKIFGSFNHTRGLHNLKKLDEGGIGMHIQIVLCPRINDRDNLLDTLQRLVTEYRYIKSIGIVPVGITRYNKNRMLEAVDREEARNTISMVEEFNIKYKTGDRIFLSDEFYIIAGLGFPDYASYHTFPQIENGIGKSRNFINQFKDMAEKKMLENLPAVLLITSEYGKYVFSMLEKELKGFNISFNLMAVKNQFLGGNVKVTGLLAGTDIAESLRNTNLSRPGKILVPDSIFNPRDLTIDGYKKDSIRKLDNKIRFTKEEAKNIIGELV
ncbi:MAG: DUF512 domain-containing protein [Actinomycetota bacterium]